MANRRDKITQRRIQAKTAPGILSSRALYLSSMILIVITAVGILWMPETVDKVMSLMISSKAIGDSMSTVERRHFDGSQTYKEIAEERQPVILTGTVVDRWPARRQFTTKFLAKRIKHVMAHVQETDRTFITFHDNKPLEDHVTEQWEDFNVKVNTTIPNVLQWGKEEPDPSKGPYLYYTQNIATIRQFPDVIGYVQPIKELILSEDNVQVNLWVGREGLVTHTHYDCTYNFFLQLQGRKRFTLFPPSESLYLYPCLHPHYGHSQMDILHPDYDKFPCFRSAQPVVAEVSPGDMLVVPPFWFHHVETLEESVSVNVWSDAPEYSIINEVYSLPIPFDENWSIDEKIIATRIYTFMILSSLDMDYFDFMKKILIERYEVLIKSGQLKLNSSLSKQIKDICSESQSWELHNSVYGPILQQGVDATAELLQTIPVRSTLKICTANFVEHLVYRVLGLDELHSFLYHCCKN